jgi:hypothetical protein
LIQDLNIYSVENFNKHKLIILDLINKIPQTPIKSKTENIQHSDWEITPKMKREYYEYFFKNIFINFAKEICNKFNCGSIQLLNTWFQVYGKDNFHSKHRHPETHFTNVFYLNLPNKNLVTKIYNLQNEPININVKEGQIITFPGYLKHESIKNESDEKKIILSYNINLQN